MLEVSRFFGIVIEGKLPNRAESMVLEMGSASSTRVDAQVAAIAEGPTDRED